MNRILIITCCDDCCHFDNEYYDYSERCTLLNRAIELISDETGVEDDVYKIPDDCPLPIEETT